MESQVGTHSVSIADTMEHDHSQTHAHRFTQSSRLPPHGSLSYSVITSLRRSTGCSWGRPPPSGHRDGGGGVERVSLGLPSLDQGGLCVCRTEHAACPQAPNSPTSQGWRVSRRRPRSTSHCALCWNSRLNILLTICKRK